MSQQINLFNPIFLKQKKHFSAVAMAQGLGLILLGSVVVAVYARFETASLEREAAATAAQLNATKAQLAKVSAEYAPRQTDKALEEEIRRLDAELKSQQQAFDIIKGGDLGNTKGYSEYLRAFSRQIGSGVWLTGFSVRGNGAEIDMRGRATKPELVPAYINRLKQEPVMQGKSFATLSMNVPEVEVEAASQTEGALPQKKRVPANYIEFTLRSSANPVEAAANDAAAPGEATAASGTGAK